MLTIDTWVWISSGVCFILMWVTIGLIVTDSLPHDYYLINGDTWVSVSAIICFILIITTAVLMFMSGLH